MIKNHILHQSELSGLTWSSINEILAHNLEIGHAILNILQARWLDADLDLILLNGLYEAQAQKKSEPMLKLEEPENLC